MILKFTAVLGFVMAVFVYPLAAQGPPGPNYRGLPPPPPPHRGPDSGFHGPPRGPFDRSLRVGPPGRWWTDLRFVQLLALTPEQQTAMDKVFEKNRPKLIDLNNSFRREEAFLRSLVASDTFDEQKVVSQIDRVASARAELEKANGRMLIGLRKVLAADQWRRLQAADEALH